MEDIVIISKKDFTAIIAKIETIHAQVEVLIATHKAKDGNNLMDAKEAADFLHISVSVLSDKAHKGEVRGYKNGIWRFFRDDLIEYAKK